MLGRLALMLAALLLAAPALAANYYVDGNAPTGVGSLADPFATIQEGVTAATVAGDSVLILPGTYAENVGIGAGDDLIISGRSGDPTDVVWQPTGTTETTSGICLVMTTGTSVTVEDLTFRGTGGANQSGYTITADNATHTVRNVRFEDLSTGFYMYNTSAGGGVMVVDRCVFIDPNPDETGQSLGVWGVQPRDAQLTITNSTFDCRGVTGEQWHSAISHGADNSRGTVIRETQFLQDQLDQGYAYYSYSQVADLLFDRCTFVGGNSKSVNDGVVKLGHTAIAGDYVERVRFVGCNFSQYGYSAIRLITLGTITGDQMNKDVVVQGCTFTSDGVLDNVAIWVQGTTGMAITGNSFNGDVIAGVQINSSRHVTVAGNRFTDTDNGVVITANGSYANWNSYGHSIVGNLFTGVQGDGALKIDNWATVAVPNDSLLTVAGNVFAGVTGYVAKWVTTSNVPNDFATLEDYTDPSTGWAAMSTLDRGNAAGASDNLADFRAGQLCGWAMPSIGAGGGGF